MRFHVTSNDRSRSFSVESATRPSAGSSLDRRNKLSRETVVSLFRVFRPMVLSGTFSKSFVSFVSFGRQRAGFARRARLSQTRHWHAPGYRTLGTLTLTLSTPLGYPVRPVSPDRETVTIKWYPSCRIWYSTLDELVVARMSFRSKSLPYFALEGPSNPLPTYLLAGFDPTFCGLGFHTTGPF